MEWIATAIAVIAALGAVWQAAEARSARKDAGVSADSASTQAAAALRSAAALERQAEIAASVARPREPWNFVKSGTHRWKVTNETGERVTTVQIIAAEENVRISTDNRSPVDLDPGQSLFFGFGGGFTDPASANVWVMWTPADGSEQKKFTKTVP